MTSKIQGIRERIETKLDRWQAQAEAIEGQLGVAREAAIERFEAVKGTGREAVAEARSKLDAAKDLAEDKRRELEAALDHLQVQLALGKAETREAFESQSRELRKATQRADAALERALGQLDGELDANAEAFSQRIVSLGDRLDAEIDGAQVWFSAQQESLQAGLDDKKRQLASQVQELKKQLEEKRAAGAQKAQAVEAQLATQVKEIRERFQKLFS